MPGQYNPEKRTIGNLLATTNPPITVPDWQRSYSWTSSEVEPFWTDLVNFSEQYPEDNIKNEEYFLGSIVVVDVGGDHLLLDGQQRLATAAILLSVIRDFLRRYSQDAATRTQSRYLGDFDDVKNAYSYKVTLNEYDRDFFKRKILEARDAAYQEPAPTLASHRLVTNARKFFEDQFETQYAQIADPGSAHRWALRIQRVLTNHMSVVAVFSQDEDNAAAVFETLNDRGIGLSTPDLVRNLVLRRAADGTREEIVDLWREILGVETDAKLKTYLRHYWISKHGDVKTQSLYREIKRKIISDDLDSLDFSRDLRDSAVVYRDLVSGTDERNSVATLLRDANELGATLLYPVMMSALAVFDEEDLVSFLESLLNVYVRHSVIGQLENSRLENVVYRLARELRGDVDLAEAHQRLGDFTPTDPQFQAAFARVEVPRRGTARYILRRLELKRRTTEELDVAPPSRVHVEHIYPQTPLPNERLAGHTRLVDRLGNLTLLSKRLNVGIRNNPFPDKKPAYEESELLITNDLTEYDEWSEQTIDERQQELAVQASEIWPMP